MTFTLPAKSFELYQGGGKWAIEPGKFTLMAGGSSDKTVLEQSIEL
jgi:beta-glucosidase